MTTTYAKERRLAELAVKRAGLLTARVQKAHTLGTLTKSDDSFVTIADLGAQALVLAAISNGFPEDSIVAEEDSQPLRESESRRHLLWGHVSAVLEQIEGTDIGADAIGGVKDESEMMDLIDKGGYEGGNQGRTWVLDPVDGTGGFLRGGQYAICLALMVNGRVVVGAVNCPNLYINPSNPQSGEHGVTFSSELGQGSTMRPSDKPALPTRISMNAITSFTEASFCESVEAAHSSHGEAAHIAARLGITKLPVRMDSQAKYVSVARGDGDIYLRLAKDDKYKEKIWDHAAGSLIVQEAGGIVSDMYGKPLDFGLGRTLKENMGVVVASKELHAKVVEAVQEAVAKRSL